MSSLLAERAAVLELLADHAPADASEERSLARIRALVEGSEDPWSRSVHAPGHLTASAVVVPPDQRRALLIFHDKLELWLQPGGHFEPGERDPHQASCREAEEETELSVRAPPGGPRLLDVDVHLIPARKGEPAHEHFDLRFLLVGEGTPRPGDGVRAIRWIDLPASGDLSLDPGLRRALGKVRPA